MSMEKRDYLMQQIEQLGQVLAQMLAVLLGMKNAGKAGLSLDEIRQTYRDDLDLPLDLILHTPSDELIELLTTRVKYIDSHLDRMGDVLKETADLYQIDGYAQSAANLYEKSLIIFEHLQISGNAFSIERMEKISRLKGILDLKD